MFLGDCHTWNPHNLKGNRENQQFVDLHDSILEANGGSWDNPPGQVVWSDQHIAVACDLLGEHASEPVFGFKDPRSLLVLDGWKKILPAIEFVGIYRHPNAVVRSLEKRSGKSRDDALKLWYTYNSQLYKEYKTKSFPILDFDDDEALLEEKIFQVAGQMGLSDQAGKQNFYSSELRSSVNMDHPSLPWAVRRLYKKLKRVGL